jgi:hypothetical protein
MMIFSSINSPSKPSSISFENDQSTKIIQIVLNKLSATTLLFQNDELFVLKSLC